MRELSPSHVGLPRTQHISPGREPGELKHLSTPRKGNDSPSSGERTGKSPNRCCSVVCRPMQRRGCKVGTEPCRAPKKVPTGWVGEGPWNGPPKRVRDP